MGDTQVRQSGGTYDEQTIRYVYDAIARLLSAEYHSGFNNPTGTLTRQYNYAYDLSGNRTQKTVDTGTPVITNYTYNAANQLTGDGTNTYTYDANGNLTSDGTNSYTWDRANRLLSFGGSSCPSAPIIWTAPTLTMPPDA